MATTISLSLPKDLAKWVEKEAERENKSKQEIIRECIEEIRFLREHKISKLIHYIDLLIEEIEELVEIVREQAFDEDLFKNG